MSGIKGGIKRCFLKSEGTTINSTIDITSLQVHSFAWPLGKLKYAYNLIHVHHFQNQ